MRLFEANVFNLLLNLQNIFRDLFLKKSNIAKISIFKVQRNLQNTYRHFIQTSSWHKPNPKYSNKNIHIYIPQDGRSNCWDLCWQGRLPFLSSVYFHVGTLPLVFKAIYNTGSTQYPISPFLYTAEPPTVRCPPKRS